MYNNTIHMIIGQKIIYEEMIDDDENSEEELFAYKAMFHRECFQREYLMFGEFEHRYIDHFSDAYN